MIFIISCNNHVVIKNEEFSNIDLFSQYYNSSNIFDQTRGGTQVEAISKFQEHDYKGAASLFKSLIDNDPNNMSLRFYYGIANIEISDYNTAISVFKYIINQNDNLYIEHAEWYLGLCYLKANNIDEAMYQFMQISQDSTNYHNENAKSIMNKISNNVNLDKIKEKLHSQTEYVDNLLLKN